VADGVDNGAVMIVIGHHERHGHAGVHERIRRSV
jgi:hypothetical protein